MVILLYAGLTVPADGSVDLRGLRYSHKADVKKPAAATRMIVAPEVRLKR